MEYVRNSDDAFLSKIRMGSKLLYIGTLDANVQILLHEFFRHLTLLESLFEATKFFIAFRIHDGLSDLGSLVRRKFRNTTRQ